MSEKPTTSSTATAATMTTSRAAEDISKLDISSPHELTAFVGASLSSCHRAAMAELGNHLQVDEVLARLENTFDTMSSQVLDRLDIISKRIDNIELSISDLVQGNSLDVPPPSTKEAGPSNA